MDKPVARAVSIAGHPAVLMPVAALIASPEATGITAFVVSLVCGGAVLGYSLYRVRRGDWTHVDASVPSERAQLNSRVACVLLAAAGVLWFAGPHIGISLVVGLAGLIVLVGHALRHVVKLSLHVAFAVFAAFLVWPNQIASVALALAAAGVAWSRIALRRHIAADIALGALVGAAVGLAVHALMARFAG